MSDPADIFTHSGVFHRRTNWKRKLFTGKLKSQASASGMFGVGDEHVRPYINAKAAEE
jgi:hypothetical protein